MPTLTARPAGVAEKDWDAFTEFQREVYRAILRIPPGQTRSYGWVARQIGKPGAARAVGNALNRNTCAPVIPCHRVVRTDGSMGGYAGGIKKKAALLRLEGWSPAI
jgi:O-6-methylguanine DNA methyltransferase